MAHLGDLRPDPTNARRHSPRNVGMVEAALREVGAARSIVIDEDGTVLAGNATIEAAAAAGIERVQIVDADGETIIAVRRTGLTPEQKTKLSLYDNRTAELAEWDEGALATLNAELDLSALFRDDEMAEILARADQSEPAWPDLDLSDQHVITLRYTDVQEEALRRFTDQPAGRPINPLHTGRKILERIEALAATDSDRA